jgi:hypothetical protein
LLSPQARGLFTGNESHHAVLIRPVGLTVRLIRCSVRLIRITHGFLFNNGYINVVISLKNTMTYLVEEIMKIKRV